MQRNFIMDFDWEMMTYVAIIAFSHAAAYFRQAQDRALRAAQLETRLAEAQLQALQRQLHPHFLFNTLNGISALMHRDVNAADRMLVRLSDLLRMALDRRSAQEVPLSDDLEFLAKYLEIEQARFGDRLTVRYDFDPDTLDALVPNLLLQPLVENSVRHAIAARSDGGVDRGHVTARRRRPRVEGARQRPRAREEPHARSVSRRRAGEHAITPRAPLRGVPAPSVLRHSGRGADRHGRDPVPPGWGPSPDRDRGPSWRIRGGVHSPLNVPNPAGRPRTRLSSG